MNYTFLIGLCILVSILYINYTTQNIKTTLLLKINDLKLENFDLKNKLEYYQSYKNDVSRTFKILDNDLENIKENLKSRNGDTPNNISLLTANTIETLLNENTSENENTSDTTGNLQGDFISNMMNRLRNEPNPLLSEINTEINPLENMFNRYLIGSETTLD